MPAPKGNRNAAKDATRDHVIHIRTTGELKGAAIRASRKLGQKLTPWIEDAIRSKLERDSGDV